jgi:serine/threonine protein kinase, bacterial
MAFTPGETFAGYTILRLLGSGGMGEVYLAQHPRLPRNDALKVLPTDISSDPEYRKRFSREADLASRLWHPNIVSVLDRGEHDGQLWITMDFVPGVNAAELLNHKYRAGMPATEVVKIITAVGGALDHAHSKGLLHRDVKPANIIISGPDEGEQRVMLADFGIAHTIGDVSGLTATNMTIGTVAYAAPEQLMGEELDGRADQYALAATSYHLLTGSQVFAHSNPAVVIGRHLNAALPRLADNRPELAVLDSVLAVALAKSPSERFKRCADFASALAESASGQPSASAAPTQSAPAFEKSTTTRFSLESNSSSSRPINAKRTGHGRRWLAVSATALVVVGGVAIVGSWRPWQARNTVPTVAPTNNSVPHRDTVTSPPISAVAPPVSTPSSTITTTQTTTATTTSETDSTSPNAAATDSQFLRSVGGISSPGLSSVIAASPQLAVETARRVCGMLDQGFGFQAVEGMVLDRLPFNDSNRSYYGGLFGVYAVQSYCPQHQADSGFNGDY